MSLRFLNKNQLFVFYLWFLWSTLSLDYSCNRVFYPRFHLSSICQINWSWASLRQDNFERKSSFLKHLFSKCMHDCSTSEYLLLFMDIWILIDLLRFPFFNLFPTHLFHPANFFTSFNLKLESLSLISLIWNLQEYFSWKFLSRDLSWSMKVD